MRKILWVLLLAACSSDEAKEAAVEPEAPQRALGKADTAFESGPLYLTGAFDGSKSFKMWVATTQFARDFKARHGKRLGFTYFINTCYYDETTEGSVIGKALSREEVIARVGLTQVAINEGHEIANHAVRHLDGSSWSFEQWEQEIQAFHRVVERQLFEPIRREDGSPVFPVYKPWEAPAGELNTVCSENADCASGMCLPIADGHSVCSARCNKNRPCSNGMACGAPDWNRSTDVCIPLPTFPVEHEGQVLFNADGNPNLDSPALQAYPIIGFRAPQLGHNGNLFKVLEQFGYTYDTSKILQPGPPQRTVHSGQTFGTLYQFALMKNPGSRTVPMDYNYKVNEAGGERMLADYKRSVVDAYNTRGRQPWNIGHHFALWKGGAYWKAMQDTFEFAALGCPDDAGDKRCADTVFPTFTELAQFLDGKIDAERIALGPKADGVAEDFFRIQGTEEANDVDWAHLHDDEEGH